MNRIKTFKIKINSKMNSYSTLFITNKSMSYINSEQAKLIDDELMGENFNYSIDQLMEIAGLSVAQSIDHAIKSEINRKVKRILNISGPGSKFILILISTILL